MTAVVRIGIEGESVRPPNDTRWLGIGLTGIGFSARSDVEGRLNIMEDLLMHPLRAAA